MPVIAKPLVFTKVTSPLVLFVALKLVIVLLLANVVPVAELVVKMAPVIIPVGAVSVIFPAVAVSVTLPDVLFKLLDSAMERPAVMTMLFAVRMLFASVISFVAPVLVAEKENKRVVPPTVPKLILPLPELIVSALLPSTLLLVVPNVIFPPEELRVVAPAMVVVPNT